MEKKEVDSKEILSNIIVYMKYARYDENLKRREVWSEIVERVKNMHIENYPQMKEEIEFAFKYVLDKKVVPSMRSLQFGGKAINITPNRIYNCSYLPVDDYRAFSEICFLLLSGNGVGFSVQTHHIEKLPKIIKPSKNSFKRYLIQDSIEGWADAVKVLIKSYFKGDNNIIFDYSNIRPAGTPIKTGGGKAPGPEPLKYGLEKIREILDKKKSGERLESYEIHDIVCHIANLVLSGGVRRSALISLFSYGDEAMFNLKTYFPVLNIEYLNQTTDIDSKTPEKIKVKLTVNEPGYGIREHILELSGDEIAQIDKTKQLAWYYIHPQRSCSNNSVLLVRSMIKENEFYDIIKKINEGGFGEPGVYFTNDKDYGTNPCGEISLRPFSFCNLTEVNISDVETQDEFLNRIKAATIIGTLQATYTNFHYLRDIWKKNTEKDSLLGVSLTGIASNTYKKLDIKEGAEYAKELNKKYAEKLGINPAARVTTIKPSGTASLVLKCSSGIHPYYAPYYIRRVRMFKNEEIYKYLSLKMPNLLEDDFFNKSASAVFSIPIKIDNPNASYRYESIESQLERIKYFFENWIKPGHNKGPNYNNISATVYVKKEEWDYLAKWMWENKDKYNGISVLPYDDGTYIQAPLEEITKEKYDELIKEVDDIDLTQLNEYTDNTAFNEIVACGGGQCDIQM